MSSALRAINPISRAIDVGEPQELRMFPMPPDGNMRITRRKRRLCKEDGFSAENEECELRSVI